MSPSSCANVDNGASCVSTCKTQRLQVHEHVDQCHFFVQRPQFYRTDVAAWHSLLLLELFSFASKGISFLHMLVCLVFGAGNT